MGGHLSAQVLQLLEQLPGDGGVALHDPGGDLLVARPGGILHQDPAVLLPHPVGQPHRVVIVQVGDLRLGPWARMLSSRSRALPLGI